MYEMDFKSKNRKNYIDFEVFFIYARKMVHRMEKYSGKWQSDREVFLYR